MKLRTTKNSIRIRIRKSELLRLRQEGKVEETINFGNSVMFSFTLILDRDEDVLTANFVSNSINVRIPYAKGIRWINSNEVGIESQRQISNSEILSVLVEKDFPCLDRLNEDKSDTFWELAPSGEKAC